MVMSYYKISISMHAGSATAHMTSVAGGFDFSVDSLSVCAARLHDVFDGGTRAPGCRCTTPRVD